jgi:hypothetical protein
VQGLHADDYVMIPCVAGEDLRRSETAPPQPPASLVGLAINAYFRVMKSCRTVTPSSGWPFGRCAVSEATEELLLMTAPSTDLPSLHKHSGIH